MSRVPTWAKRAALGFAAAVLLTVVIAKTVDLKGWLRSQLARPKGIGGRFVALLMPMFHRPLYGPAAERLHLVPEDELLEVACGSGAFLAKHAGDVHRVAGIDLSEIQVALAKQRLTERVADGTADIRVGDAVDLPWFDESFTAVACIGSLDIFSEPERALHEMARVLKPGGRLVITWGVDENDEACVAEMERWGFPVIPEADARKALEDAGFGLVTVTYREGSSPDRYLEAVKPE
jgi:SAM-dependent methyltransferase